MKLNAAKYMYPLCSHLIGHNWDEEIRRWVKNRFSIPPYEEFKYSCSGRCGRDEREASAWRSREDLPKCFCDKLCDEFGDCCFDFNAL